MCWFVYLFCHLDRGSSGLEVNVLACTHIISKKANFSLLIHGFIFFIKSIHSVILFLSTIILVGKISIITRGEMGLRVLKPSDKTG